MNKFLLTLLVVSSSFFFGCKKTSNAPTASQWTIMGTTYKGDTTYNYQDSTSQDILSNAGSGNGIGIPFASKPVANGTYDVIGASSGLPNLSPNQCQLFVSIGTNYYHSFEARGTVMVTVVNGKLNLQFSNVPVTDITDTTTVSGYLIEQ
jgi:hypothetical protein